MEIADRLGVGQPLVSLDLKTIRQEWRESSLRDFDMAQAIELQRTFQPDWFGVETNQFQQLLADELMRRSGERGVLMPLFTIQNNVNKLVRIRRLTPYLSQGRIRFKGGSPGARLLVEQLRDFPNADHDDGPDALEMAVRLAANLLARAQQPRERITGVLGY